MVVAADVAAARAEILRRLQLQQDTLQRAVNELDRYAAALADAQKAYEESLKSMDSLQTKFEESLNGLKRHMPEESKWKTEVDREDEAEE